jgi:hypothetical protein
MKSFWGRVAGATLVGAFALAAVMGPGHAPVTRLGASDQAAIAVDTVTSARILTEGAGAGRSRAS